MSDPLFPEKDFNQIDKWDYVEVVTGPLLLLNSIHISEHVLVKSTFLYFFLLFLAF